MKTFKNTLRVILPHFGRNKRVFGVNLKAIVPYSVQQFTCSAYEWNGVDVAKGLSVLKTFPYNLSYMVELVSLLFFAYK